MGADGGMTHRRWTAALLCPALLFFCACGYGGFLRCAAAPAVSARSAVVYEPQSGTFLFEKDSRTPRPMASTTKLMTALLAAEELQADATVSVPAGAVPVEGTQIGLAAGDTVTVRDLLTGLLLASGNDAANALALLTAENYAAFAERMNVRALELGMEDSRFVTPSGLDADGHAASARDMALLAAAVLNRPLLTEICASKTAPVTVGDRHLTLKNHNRLLSLCDGCIGLKTGFTKKAGRCLVSAAERGGVTLIAVTLNAPDDWNDHMALYDYAFSLVHSERMPAAAPESVPVAGGERPAVPLSSDEPPACVLLRDETVTVTVELPRFVWAPVRAGDRLGTVRYTAGEREVAFLPLIAAADVSARPVPGFAARVWRHLRQLTEILLR